MNILKLSLIAAFVLGVTSANAGSIRCGTEVIQDGGENPPSMDEVIALCGEPSERTFGVLIYKEKGVRLEFDDDGKLAVIHQLD